MTNDSPTVQVLYTCHGCSAFERPVPVVEREKDEPILQWIETVKHAVGEDHARLSPLCMRGEVDLKIPLTKKENFFIGEAQRQ